MREQTSHLQIPEGTRAEIVVTLTGPTGQKNRLTIPEMILSDSFLKNFQEGDIFPLSSRRGIPRSVEHYADLHLSGQLIPKSQDGVVMTIKGVE